MDKPFGEGQDPDSSATNPPSYPGDQTYPSYPSQTGAAAGGYEDTVGTVEPGKFDALEAFSQAWKIFRERPLVWLVGGLLYAAVVSSYKIWTQNKTSALVTRHLESGGELSGVFAADGWALIAGVGLVLTIIEFIYSVALATMATNAVAGRRVEFGDYLKLHRALPLLGASILASIFTLLGLLALIVGVLVVVFFLMFVTSAAAVDGTKSFEALKQSASVVKRNPGSSLVLALISMIIGGLCGITYIGIAFATPFAALAAAHAYRTAQLLPVATRS